MFFSETLVPDSYDEFFGREVMMPAAGFSRHKIRGAGHG